MSSFCLSTTSFKSTISSSWSSIIFCRFSTSSSFFQNWVGKGPGFNSMSPVKRNERKCFPFYQVLVGTVAPESRILFNIADSSGLIFRLDSSEVLVIMFRSETRLRRMSQKNTFCVQKNGCILHNFLSLGYKRPDLHSNCTLDKGTLGRDKIHKNPEDIFLEPPTIANLLLCCDSPRHPCQG